MPRGRGNARQDQNNDLFAAMYRAFQGMATHAQNDNQGGDSKQGYLRDFIQSRAASFNGEAEPKEAEDWFKSIVKHLNTQGVLQEYRVEFASYKFEGQADFWWDRIKRTHDVNTMTWEQFEGLFYNRYFPQPYRDMNTVEFMSLQ